MVGGLTRGGHIISQLCKYWSGLYGVRFGLGSLSWSWEWAVGSGQNPHSKQRSTCTTIVGKVNIWEGSLGLVGVNVMVMEMDDSRNPGRSG